MLIWSEVRSTDFDRKRKLQEYYSRHSYPGCDGAVLRTIPRSRIQPQLFNNVFRMPTPFRTGKPLVNLDQYAIVPLALVFKLSNQFSPNRITNRERKFPIPDHVFHKSEQGFLLRRWIETVLEGFLCYISHYTRAPTFLLYDRNDHF